MELAIDDAKERLSDLVRRAEAGENVVLTRHGHAVAQLVSVSLGPNAKKRCEIDVKKERRAIIEEICANAVREAKPGPDAARSQDFLYDDLGLPGRSSSIRPRSWRFCRWNLALVRLRMFWKQKIES